MFQIHIYPPTTQTSSGRVSANLSPNSRLGLAERLGRSSEIVGVSFFFTKLGTDPFLSCLLISWVANSFFYMANYELSKLFRFFSRRVLSVQFRVLVFFQFLGFLCSLELLHNHRDEADAGFIGLNIISCLGMNVESF